MQDADIRIRDAIEDDAATLADLVHQLAVSTGEGHRAVAKADAFRRFGFGDACWFHALIAEKDDTAVGLALWLYEFSSWRGKPGVYLQDLFVDGKLRGSGLGRRLLAAVCRKAVAAGADHMRLSVNTDNQAAREFYAHLGFKFHDDERIYQLSDQALADFASSGEATS